MPLTYENLLDRAKLGRVIWVQYNNTKTYQVTVFQNGRVWLRNDRNESFDIVFGSPKARDCTILS